MKVISVAPHNQKANKNWGVITEMENYLPWSHRHNVDNVIARKTSLSSARFVDMRFDSYKPQTEKMP